MGRRALVVAAVSLGSGKGRAIERETGATAARYRRPERLREPRVEAGGRVCLRMQGVTETDLMLMVFMAAAAAWHPHVRHPAAGSCAGLKKDQKSVSVIGSSGSSVLLLLVVVVSLFHVEVSHAPCEGGDLLTFVGFVLNRANRLQISWSSGRPPASLMPLVSQRHIWTHCISLLSMRCFVTFRGEVYISIAP